ncbi:MAG TPA: acyl carrier protein [Acidimicrobiales bacterium]|nr:acyl carrier protein [Acidimicrobiales bacterium]
MNATELDDEIRVILASHGRLFVDLGSLRDDQDLFRSGMTSYANVNVMLAIEERFDVEFPDHMLRKSTFQSVSSIRGAISELLAEQGAEAVPGARGAGLPG